LHPLQFRRAHTLSGKGNILMTSFSSYLMVLALSVFTSGQMSAQVISIPEDQVAYEFVGQFNNTPTPHPNNLDTFPPPRA